MGPQREWTPSDSADDFVQRIHASSNLISVLNNSTSTFHSFFLRTEFILYTICPLESTASWYKCALQQKKV